MGMIARFAVRKDNVKVSASNLDSLKVKLREGKAVGLNQSKKLIKSGFAESVCIACDADTHIREEIKSLCRAYGVSFDDSKNMVSLGQVCGIDVGCAVYAVCKIR